MSTKDKVQIIVENTIQQGSGLETLLSHNDELINSGILDSLTLLQLFVNLQSEFNVEIDTMELTEENFATIEAISSFIQEKCH